MNRDIRPTGQIGILSGETATVRTAGIVRHELAQLLALDDQHLESLRLHALNRELHPRFYRGRYRLAMSLEMITNPEHYLLYDEATLRKLAETLEIISRYGHIDGTLQENAKNLRDAADRDVAEPSGGKALCMPVPQELALKLLEIAAEDLREVRTQLNLGHVVWDAFFRRDERSVWLPHRKRRHRRSFQDGVCAAELLVAIRCRFREPASTDPGWLKHARVRWHLRRAIRITSCIVGDPSFIYSALADPRCKWWEPEVSTAACLVAEYGTAPGIVSRPAASAVTANVPAPRPGRPGSRSLAAWRRAGVLASRASAGRQVAERGDETWP